MTPKFDPSEVLTPTPLPSATQSSALQTPIATMPSREPLEELRTIATKLLSKTAAVSEKKLESSEEFCKVLEDSVELFETVIELALRINDTCQIHDNRGLDVGLEIMPIAFKHLAELYEKHQSSGMGPVVKKISDDALRFVKVFQVNKPANVKIPGWFNMAAQCLDIISASEKLPNAFPYMAKSATLAESGARFKAQHTKYKEALSGLKTARMLESDQAENARVLMEETLKKADSELSKVNDVQILSVEECAHAMEITTAVKGQYLIAATKMLSDLGLSIQAIALGESFNAVSIYSLEKLDKSINLKEQEISSAELPREFNSNETLKTLVSLYLRLRDSLVDYLETYTSHADQRRADISILTKALSDIFPRSDKPSAETVSALVENSDPAINSMATLLLASKVAEISGDTPIIRYALECRGNIELVNILLPRLIIDPSPELLAFVEGFSKGSLHQVVEVSRNIRKLLKAGNYVQLAAELNSQLDTELNSNYSSYVDKVVTLAALAGLATNTETAAKLKGMLKLIDQIPTFCQKILQAERNDPAIARIIEKNRRVISRGFNSSLKDYYGHAKAIKDIRRIVEEHLKLVDESKRWEGIPPKLVFLNGIVFYGKPGVGKSFLVECLSNEYGLPVVTISREEMSKTRRPTDNSAKPTRGDSALAGLENRFEAFLASKVAQANSQMELNGSPSCIIMIDEMEAEFLNRDPATSPRHEIDQTNVMLRVLEDVMKKNYALLFMGATNYLSLVDSAALRIGRFGLQFELGDIQKEDAVEILKATSELLKIDFKELQTASNYEALTEACCGLTTLPVQTAIIRATLLNSVHTVTPEALIELFIEALDNVRAHSINLRTKSPDRQTLAEH